MLRKWELISREVRPIDPTSALIADAIDGIVYLSQKNHHTSFWEQDYEKISNELKSIKDPVDQLYYLRDLAINDRYCSLCYPSQGEERSIFCENCIMDKVDFICRDFRSLFYLFIARLRELIWSF